MLNDTILSIRKDAKKIIRQYEMDFEDYQLLVSLHSNDDTNDVNINITYSDETGAVVAETTGEIFPNAALLRFQSNLSVAAARRTSVTGLTL